MGAVDAVDTSAGTISVLGRTLRMPSADKVAELMASGRQLLVAVSGQMSPSGTLEKMKLRFVPTDYVAGATQVIVSGRANSIDASLGTMKIGKLTIDVSSVAGMNLPVSGSLVQVVGTQPVRQGLVIAERLHVK